MAILRIGIGDDVVVYMRGVSGVNGVLPFQELVVAGRDGPKHCGCIWRSETMIDSMRGT